MKSNKSKNLQKVPCFKKKWKDSRNRNIFTINCYLRRQRKHNEWPSPLSVSADLFHDFGYANNINIQRCRYRLPLRNPWRPQNDANPGWILIFYVVLFPFSFSFLILFISSPTMRFPLWRVIKENYCSSFYSVPFCCDFILSWLKECRIDILRLLFNAF